MLDLDAFLDQQRSEGAHQSEGTFSLSARKALEKMSKYQLELPGLWLVKMVQSGVAAGASRIVVKLRRDTLQVSFPCRVGLTAKQLWEAVLHGEDLSPAQQHLVTAIRALYGQHEDLAWICQDDQGTTLLSLQDGKLKEKQTDATGEAFQLVAERSQGRKALGLNRWLGRSLEEMKLVKARCWASPSPIFLDGRRLTQGGDPTVETVASWECGFPDEERAVLGSFREQGRARLVAETPYPFFYTANPSHLQPYFQQWKGTETGLARVGPLLTLETGEDLQSRVRYVFHGALVEGPELGLKLPEGFALRAYLPMDELKVDLSQFRTQQPMTSGRRSAIYKEAREFLLRFLDCLEGRLGTRDEISPQAQGAGASLATAATFLKTKALFLGLGLPVGLLVGGGVATAMKMRQYNRNMQRVDLANVCRAGIRQLERLGWSADLDDVADVFRRQ